MNRIIVTGGKGFLGKVVTTNLHSMGMVHALDSSMYDLRSYEETEQMYIDFNPNIVVHLAATVGGIGANKENPGKFIEENLVMGYNTIKLAKEYGVEKFVMLGTVCSYPKHCPVPFKEEDLWNGYPEETNAPYGIAKKTLMQMIQSYNQQYGFNGINLIPVNMYGPNDNFDPKSSHVIPALILNSNKQLIMVMNPLRFGEQVELVENSYTLMTVQKLSDLQLKNIIDLSQQILEQVKKLQLWN